MNKPLSLNAEAQRILSRYDIHFSGYPQGVNQIYKAICRVRGKRPDKSTPASIAYAIQVFVDEHQRPDRGMSDLLTRPAYQFDIGMRQAMLRVADARVIRSLG